MVDNYTLRARARAQLGHSIFKNSWFLVALACIIPVLAETVLASIPVIGTIASIVVAGPLTYSLYSITTKVSRGESWELKLFLDGFKEGVGTSIFLYVLRALFVALWSLLFIIPGIVKSYAYSMAFYIKQDDKDSNKEAKEYLDQSAKMMNGYKKKLFLLDLSFIGWYLLGIICFGIGVFFVYPYHETARANFYLELKNNQETK